MYQLVQVYKPQKDKLKLGEIIYHTFTNQSEVWNTPILVPTKARGRYEDHF